MHDAVVVFEVFGLIAKGCVSGVVDVACLEEDEEVEEEVDFCTLLVVVVALELLVATSASDHIFGLELELTLAEEVGLERTGLLALLLLLLLLLLTDFNV